jgi:aspartyl aminopeptidase
MADNDNIVRLIADLEASPTPYHAVQIASQRLVGAGFELVDLGIGLPTGPGSYAGISGGSLVAWSFADDAPPSSFCVVGAHTDSPNLRVRSKPDISSAGISQVGVEVYGGVLLNSWLDRDLGLAGRVSVGSGVTSEQRLINIQEPILRIPQLAIHLDREIREMGLKLNPQTQMTPMWATGDAESGDFNDWLAGHLDVDPSFILSWDLMTYDVVAPAVVGRDQDMLASARIDNLFSSFCATYALADSAQNSAPGTIPILVLFDHEEVGSASATGAAGGFLSNALERIGAACGLDRIGYLQALANSYVVSADGAHATHPNYVDKHEPNHHIALNGGVVVKRNSNQRYASDAASEARFRMACATAEVPIQTYIHRNDLPCGSTIGPITAAQLGVPTIDIGAPQLGMHSIRELAGTADVEYLTAALSALWCSE